MKRIIILLVVLIFNSNGVDRITKLEIRKVDFSITTIIRVNCNDFEKYFGKEIKTDVVKYPNGPYSRDPVYNLTNPVISHFFPLMPNE